MVSIVVILESDYIYFMFFNWLSLAKWVASTRWKRWKTGNIGEISTFNPMAQDMTFDTGDLKIEDDGIEEFF